MNRQRHKAPSLRPLVGLVVVVAMAGCARPSGLARNAIDTGPDDAVLQEDYDPWQPFNEAMFDFNHDVLDRWIVKPLATGWAAVTPPIARRSVARVLNNIDMPRRFVNNLLQARPLGAGRELARFFVNTTIGVAGVMDIASEFHLDPSEADAGETLALLGVGPGPFLVLPTLPPTTVRDAIGRGLDSLLDPLSYLVTTPFFVGLTRSIVSAVNERSLNMQLYDNVEESVIDLYSAARNGYLQRRHQTIERAMADRDKEWMWAARDEAPDTAHVTNQVVTVALEDPT
ncbi:MAG TPA: VacJ family lipoprotein [Candidatus Eisenbacteria bacterium]|nr:VacJ family lipoprotein [Candidatus Eisenbacteria bacterium]